MKPVQQLGNGSTTLIRQSGSIVILLGLALSGCDWLDQQSNDYGARLDRGIHEISSNSTLWVDVLQQLARDIPSDVEVIVQQMVQQLASRSIATAGTELRCNTDFLGERAVQALKNVKILLAGEPRPPDLPPAFCQVTPEAIDLNLDPRAWGKITLHGYDLDHVGADKKPIAFGMQRGTSGQIETIPESHIGRTHHYQVTVNMKNIADKLYDDGIVKIVPLWSGSLAGTMSGEVVVQEWRPATERRLQDLGSQTFTPPHVAGDKDFDTGDREPMAVVVSAESRLNGNRIEGRVYMFARESEPDHTKAEGDSGWLQLYKAPEGWRIDSYSPDHSAKIPKFNITKHGNHAQDRPGGEVVSTFDIFGDTEGDDAGGYTKTVAHWRPITITLKSTRPDWR